METRELELTAVGCSLGDSFILGIEEPKNRVHLDQTVIFKLTLTPEGGSVVPETLLAERGSDVEFPERSLKGSGMDDGSVIFYIPLILRGGRGSSVLRFQIKGEEVKATLAMGELDLFLHSSKIEVDIENAPLEWNGRSDIALPVVFSHDSRSKVRIVASLQILDEDGSVVLTTDSCDITIRHWSRIELNASGKGYGSKGRLKAVARMKVDGDQQESVVEDAISVDDGIIVDAPKTIAEGEMLELRISGLDTDSDHRIALELNERGPMKPQSVDIEDGIYLVRFDLRGEMEKKNRISVIVDGDELSNSEVFMEDDVESLSISLRMRERTVSPGSMIKGYLDVTGDDDISGTSAYIDLDIEGSSPREIGDIGENGHVDITLDIPPSTGTGDVSGKVELRKNGEVIGREVFRRLFTVSSVSTMDLEIIIPGREEHKEGFQAYLLPNEKISSPRKYIPFDLIELNSGRVLIINNDRPAPVSDAEEEKVSKCIMIDTFLDSLVRSGILESSKREFSKMIAISHSGPRDDNTGKGLKGISGSLQQLLKKGVKDPTEPGSGEDKNDPLHGLMSKIEKAVIAGPEGETFDDQSLKGFVEDLIKNMKGSDKELSGSSYLRVLKYLSGSGIDSLERLKKASDSEIELEKAESALVRFLFHLLIFELVKVEIASNWSHPVINAWDDLRIERQKMIKYSIQLVFGTVDRIFDLRRAGKARYRNYISNLNKRRVCNSLSRMDIKMPQEGFSGFPGEIWNTQITMRLPEGSPEISIDPFLSLPKGGWSLESPSSMRQGDALALKKLKIGGGERRDLELRVRSPQNPRAGARAKLYLHSDDLELEAEE